MTPEVLAAFRRRRRRFFEWFAVAVVLFVFALILLPNLIDAFVPPRRSYQKRTMADMRSIATAVEAYGTDYNRYPVANSITELGQFISPTYIRTLPGRDGWGTEFRYLAWKERPEDEAAQNYRIASAGKDRKFEHEDLRRYREFATQHFDCDIVYGQGAFIQYPEGIQTGEAAPLTATITETTPPAEAALAWLRSGDDAFEWGNYKVALERYQKAIDADPANVQAHIGAGCSHLVLGNSAAAAPLLKRAAELNPADPTPWIEWANYLSDAGDAPESLAIIAHALKVAPANAAVWHSASMVYRRAGRHEQALKAIAQAEKLGLSEDDFLYQLGLIHVARADYAAAREQHQKLVRLNPTAASRLLEAINR